MWAALIPAAMQMAGGLFSGGQKNPADAAMPEFDEAKSGITKYLSPYATMGQQMLPYMQNQYTSMLNDPNAIMSKLGAGYQQSPGYKFEVGQATDAANRAASAGGMTGSPMEQQNLASVVQGLAGKDYNSYLNNVMGVYQGGLNGLGNLNQMGFEGSNSMAEDLVNLLQNQAKLAYAGQENQNQSSGGLFGGLLGGLGDLGGGLLKKLKLT